MASQAPARLLAMAVLAATLGHCTESQLQSDGPVMVKTIALTIQMYVDCNSIDGSQCTNTLELKNLLFGRQ